MVCAVYHTQPKITTIKDTMKAFDHFRNKQQKCMK